METLVLGGSGFLGSHVVEAALADGHRVVVVARQVWDERPPEVELVLGDRLGSLGGVRRRSWDAVLDLSGFEPAAVEASAAAVGRSAGVYLFVSSVAAYADHSRAGIDEGSPLAADGSGYGPRKAACERALRARLGDRLLVVRPGFLAGPGDRSGRFASWPLRVARGGDVLVPGPPERPVQFLDVRDLAAWLVHLAATRASGTFNAVGPGRPLTAAGLFDACRKVTGGDARPVWADEDFLLAEGVEPLRDVPLWTTGAWSGFQQVDGRRAVAAGLTFRAVETTVGDAWRWALEHSGAWERRGLAPERESRLLAAWEQERR